MSVYVFPLFRALIALACAVFWFPFADDKEKRIISAQETPDWTLGPYLIQTLLLLVAPALFAASIYMVLGRIILLTEGERHSMIRQKWLTKLFVAGDVLSFMTQSAGKS